MQIPVTIKHTLSPLMDDLQYVLIAVAWLLLSAFLLAKHCFSPSDIWCFQEVDSAVACGSQ